MALEYDAAKDATIVVKHEVSLARASDLEIVARIADDRFEEPRFRAYGFIDRKPHCLAYVLRGQDVRAISLRRAHQEELDRYGG